MANFSVAARTLIHLGAELITSDEVALNELIKNAFDAESPRVKISFHISVPQQKIKTALTKIDMSDTAEKYSLAVESAYLDILTTIAALPEGGERSELMEKLSRFQGCESREDAMQMLESLNYITVEDSGTGMDAKVLESVFLHIGTESRFQDHASKNLQRRILGNKGIGRLSMMRLGDRAKVTSWTQAKNAYEISFDWRAFEDPSKQIDDISLDVVKIPLPPRPTSSGTVITISALKSSWTEKIVQDRIVGEYIRRLQDPFAVLDKNNKDSGFPVDVHVNRGRRIPIAPMKDLLTNHLQIDFDLTFDPHGVEDAANASVILLLELMDHRLGSEPIITQRTICEVTHKTQASLEELIGIGPFSAKIRWFNREKLRDDVKQSGAWKATQKELDTWSGGVSIYRDGFRLGFTGQANSEDWLGLDRTALKRSGYTVNRIQTIGALRISRKDNPKLIDRSNREGLIESRETDLVRQILIGFAIDDLRRHIDHEGRVYKQGMLEDLVENAPVTILDRATQAEQSLNAIKDKVSDDVNMTIRIIQDHLHFIKSEVRYFEEASNQAIARREDILELAGVGTVMSGVLHELARTTGNTRQLLQTLATQESPRTQALLDKLEAEIKAINTRLRQLDPLTPSGRHHKEKFDLAALLRTIIEGYHARFERHQIRCMLDIPGSESNVKVMVDMVRGFVSLAVENLMTNSVYWLQQGLKAGETVRCIRLELDPVSRTLIFSDNGPGISPADKQRVFTAGFSLRPRGQGLGLFIAAEVAAYHKARLLLDSVDNDGRCRSFVLELPRG